MTPKTLRITIKSAATFGRGDGVAGLVDREIEHDKYGLPFLRGKTLKGLLAESAENIVYALKGTERWRTAKDGLFGLPGRGGIEERGSLHIGDASLPQSLQAELRNAVSDEDNPFTAEDVLHGLTGIRRQTAMNTDGGPDHASLRSMRVLLPGVILESELHFDVEPNEDQLSLLTASALDLRRAGTGRNRGRGHILLELDDDKSTRELYEQFEKAVTA